MSDGDFPCSVVIDCAGLHEILRTRSNRVRATCLDHLQKGIIGVPACVWREFADLYEEEAEVLGPYVKRKLRMKQSYLIGAARIADKLNSGFPVSPYDEKTDFYAAAVCAIEGHTLLTVSAQLGEYQQMGCRKVVEIGVWVEDPDV